MGIASRRSAEGSFGRIPGRSARSAAIAILVVACNMGPTDTQPPANTAAPPSGSLSSPSASPTAAVGSPTPAIVSGHWPYETTGQISDVLFALDGRVVVVEGNLGAETSRVVTLTADGAIVDGWPWAPPPTGDWIAMAELGPDGSVYVAVRGAQGLPSTYT